MLHKRDLTYLDHILQSAAKAIEYLNGVGYHDFLANEEKQDAVVRKIEICGEATKRLSLEFRNAYPAIPWKAIAGMRDKLIHDYLDIDLDMVWDTVEKDLPGLIVQLEKIRLELEN